MVVVGSKRMVQYDDTASDEPVRVYDRGMDFTTPANFGEYQLTYRSGDVVIPRIDAAEPLGLELEDFARAIRTGSRAALERPARARDRGRHRRRAGVARRRGGEPVSLARSDVRAAGVTPQARASLRVCMVHYSDFGVDSRIQRQARALAERGDEVHLVCLSPSSAVRRGRGEIHVHGVWARRPAAARRATSTGYGAFFARALRRVSALDTRCALRPRRSPQHAGLPRPSRARCPKRRGAPVILNVHDTFPELFATKFGAERRGGRQR